MLKPLKGFLKWFKKKKNSPNLTALANMNMPQNKGSKRGTRKRKGAANKQPTDVLTVLLKRLTHSHITSNQIQPGIPPSNFPNQHRAPLTSIVPQYDVLPTSVPLQHMFQATMKAQPWTRYPTRSQAFQNHVSTQYPDVQHDSTTRN